MSSSSTPPSGPAPKTRACYKHPGRPSNITCQRCDRVICTKCMTEASVGFHCPECISEGAKSVRQVQTRYGGKRSADPSLTSKVLVGLNVAVFLLIVLTGGPGGSEWVYKLALFVQDNYLISEGEGSTSGISVYGFYDGAWWTLISAAFVHQALWHLGFNMVALWFLGPELEAAVGRLRFLAIYFISAIAGNALAVVLMPVNGGALGASGAIFGVMGAILVLLIKEKRPVKQLAIWLGINLIITFSGFGNISWEGHLGGLVGGAAAAAILAYAPRGNTALASGTQNGPGKSMRSVTHWVLLGALALAWLALAFFGRTV